MSAEDGDVRRVFITVEAAEQVGLNANYMLRLAKQLELDEAEMRPVGPRGFLFSAKAIEKIKAAKGGIKRHSDRENKSGQRRH